MEIDTIQKDTLKLPESIYIQEQHVLDLVNKVNDLTNNINRTEIAIKAAVANEVDPNGKPLFSNELKREAETRVRLAENENYKILVQTHNTISNDLELAKTRLHLLNNQLRAHIAVLQSRRSTTSE